jgi:hypothetical protein
LKAKLDLKLLIVLATAVSAAGQTTINPDISAVGDVRVFGHDDRARPDERNEINIPNPELELVINGYLNPYARADFVVAWHGEHNAEIEEAYATILRGLPFGMNLRAGKYLLEFGRLNPVHPHAYSFVQRPLPHSYLFGSHGLDDMAIRSSIMLPAGETYTELMVALLKGDALATLHHGEEEEEHEHEGDDDRDPGFFGRLTSSLAVSDYSELAFGVSALNAVYAFSEDSTSPGQLRSWLFGGDIKYKFKPSRYTSLQIESEGIVRIGESDEAGDDLISYGAYGYVDYRFRQKYNVGAILEWVTLEEEEHIDVGGEHQIHKHDIWQTGLFAGYAPIEETSLVRLVGNWTEPEQGDGFWEVILQFVFSLGPHQPHNF